MAFKKSEFISDAMKAGMEEAQADLLFDNQTKLFDHVPSKKDLTDMQTSIQVQQTNLRHEIDGKIDEASNAMRRELNEQVQKTRFLIDDVQSDVKKTEARLEGLLRLGFASVNYKFNVLAFSNTAVIITVVVFMYFLMRG